LRCRGFDRNFIRRLGDRRGDSFIFGALIFTTGFNLLYEWCVRSARRLPLPDYLSILAIVAVVVRFGYVAGVLTGILIGCIIFVVSYSRVRVVKHDLSADVFRSSVLRSLEERDALQAHGKAIRILVLQGFIFFGMADRLYRTIKELLEEPGQHPDFLILDFHGVHGLDSSAATSFSKIQQLATRDQSKLIISAIAPDLEKQWRFGGDGQHGVLEFRDLDAALEYCEGELLRKRVEHLNADTSLEQWLGIELGEIRLAHRLGGFLEKRELSEGDILCEEGTPAQEMFFIEQGRVGVIFGSGEESVRLRSLGERTILGEMGLYRSRVRSASVIAEQSSTVYVLSREAFNRMEKTDPVLAAAFNAAIVRTLADRLEFESAMVASLQR
jgi:SulP family sulfate permease